MKLIGVDIGKEGDPSAMGTLDVQVIDKETEADLTRRGWDTIEKRGMTMYDLIHIENLPIKLNYPNVVERIKKHMHIPAIANDESYLIIEINGPGEPILDYCLLEGLSPTGIFVTNGNSITARESNGYNVGKRLIVTTFQTLVQTGRFRYSKEIPKQQLALFLHQMENFVMKQHDRTGNEYWENLRPEDHDDMVMATASPLWYAERILMAGYLQRPQRRSIQRSYNPLLRKQT